MATDVASRPASTWPVHPLRSRARVLLCSVFGPYACDDEYGSRSINPMELYQNQVTRTQGPFSLRMFHRSWGLMLIQNNIAAPCMLLDFPTLDRFEQELRQRSYDVIGISSIPVNIGKVRKMCELIRRYQPQATIVVGGHIANLRNVEERLDADHVVRGEGVRWFRNFLGEDPQAPIRHPLVVSGLGVRAMGMTLRDKPGDTAATLIPSVGCPLGCNFCSTSAMFGGKGKFVNFYGTGDELFDVMCQLEVELQVQSFFVMDENFLLHRKRALRLLELMQQHDKAWALYVFSSANVLRGYTIEQLLGLGISWVWMGLEGEDSQYAKLHDIDSRQLVAVLQSHGIHVLGSSIIGLENHSPQNIDAVIDYAVGHATDFHQFMLYTPVEGTPLHSELVDQGRMKSPSEFDAADIHGQHIFNYRHDLIPEGEEKEYLLRAFQRDFEVHGPSILRVARTNLVGWRRHRDHPDPRVRRRVRWACRELGTTMAAAVWATVRYFHRHGQPAQARMWREMLEGLYREFGWRARLWAGAAGPYVLWQLRREEKRLAGGWTYEPPTFYETNFQVDERGRKAPADALPCRSVVPRSAGEGTWSTSERRTPVAVG